MIELTWPVCVLFLASVRPAQDDVSRLSPASAVRSRETASPQGGHQGRGGVHQGVWGGPHIRLEVTDQGAEVEFDCAHGTIPGPLKLDHAGRFRSEGTYVQEHGGPVRDDETGARRPARYSGTVDGKTMRLTVTFTDASEDFGTFELLQGSEGELVKCR